MKWKKIINQLHLQNCNSTAPCKKVSGFRTVVAENQQLNKSIKQIDFVHTKKYLQLCLFRLSLQSIITASVLLEACSFS